MLEVVYMNFFETLFDIKTLLLLTGSNSFLVILTYQIIYHTPSVQVDINLKRLYFVGLAMSLFFILLILFYSLHYWIFILSQTLV